MHSNCTVEQLDRPKVYHTKPNGFMFLLFVSVVLIAEKKINIVHLVFVGIHEQEISEISASSAELFRRDPQLYFSNTALSGA